MTDKQIEAHIALNFGAGHVSSIARATGFTYADVEAAISRLAHAFPEMLRAELVNPSKGPITVKPYRVRRQPRAWSI